MKFIFQECQVQSISEHRRHGIKFCKRTRKIRARNYATLSAKTKRRRKETTPHDLHDNDSPAVYSRWAFNLGSWSSHDAGDDAAASSPCRPSILPGERCTFRNKTHFSRVRKRSLFLFSRHPRRHQRRRLFLIRQKSSCSVWRSRSAGYRATHRSPVRTLACRR